jgi:hypothetical protein
MVSSPLNPQKSLWKKLYVAALRETDPLKVPELIASAEREIVARAHQLFNSSGDHLDEGEALDDALYMLRALKGCLQHRFNGEYAA